MKKRVLTLLMVLVLAFAVVAPAYAAEATWFTVTPDKTSVAAGDTVTYTVSMGPVSDLYGLKFKLVIPEGLTFKEGSSQTSSGLKETLDAAKAEFTESTKVFIIGSSDYTSEDSLVLFTFQCTVNEDAVPGEKAVTVKYDEDDIFNLDYDNISVDFSNLNSAVSVICEHTETELQNAKNATCTEEGYTGDKVCKACGETVTPGTTTSTTEHNYVVDKVVDPTCTAEGYTVYTCSGCGGTKNGDTVSALGHTEGEAVEENIVAATCTEGGSYDEVVYCTVCEEEISRETKTVDALGHDEVTDAAVAATCTETGKTEGSHCDRCSEVLVAQTVVDALGHDVKVDEAVAATCTATGLTEGKHCDRCSEVLVAQTVVDALGHTGGEATCIAKAVCTRCDEEYGELNANNHKGTSNLVGAKEATCTEDGATGTGTCSDCGAELKASEVISALGHAMDEGIVTTEPTCETDGVKTFTCTREGCDHEETEVVEKLGHAYDSGIETTPATCETEGVKTFTCANDASHTYTEDIPAIGHDYDDGTVTTEPTCEADGVKTFVCQNDPSHTYTEAIPALGHEFDLDEGAAMKNADDQHWIVCAREGCDATTDKEDCSVGEEGWEATCQEAAICGTCGGSFGEADPSAHNIGYFIENGQHQEMCGNEGCGYLGEWEACTYDNGTYEFDDDYHWHVCDVCGVSAIFAGAEPADASGYGEHVWGEWVTEEAPTATEDGYALRQCETCGAWAEKILPATGSSGSSDKNNADIPDTGDDSPIVLLAIVTVMCGASVLVLTTKKRKN